MRLLKLLIATPLAAAILILAYANREWVTIYLDPIGVTGLKPVPAPEYAVILVATAIGVVAGGVASWFGQSGHRRALRDAEAEAARLRQDLQSARMAAQPTFSRTA